MLVTLDLDRTTLVFSASSQAAVTTLKVPYGSGVQIRVLPMRNGVAEELGADFEMVWEGKVAGDFGGDALFSATAFTLDATTGHYVADVAYDGAVLQALLELGETPEAGSVIVDAQLAWRVDDAAAWQPSQVVALTIHNSVWRDAGSTVIPSAKGPVPYYRDIIGLTGGGATKLDGIATVSLPARTRVQLVINDGTYDVLQNWMLYAGTDAEDGVGIVRPDDYATTTNEKVWKLIA